MRIQRAALPVAGALAATLLLPTAAAADDSGTGARGWKDDTGSNPSISAEVISRSSQPARQMQRRAENVQRQAPRQGGLAQGLARIAEQVAQPILDQLDAGCGTGLGVGDQPVAIPASLCRATDPAEPEAATPAGGPAPVQQVDARALAERAMSELSIPAPELRMSPEDPVKALVGLETWLWVPQGQWQPLTASAEAGGTEVTVTAEPIQSRWDMGEDTVNCPGPGREWRKGLGQKAKTSCGFTYERTSAREPNRKHDVSAAIRYRVMFTCDGDCSEDGGDLGTLDSPTSTSELEVTERQSVVVR